MSDMEFKVGRVYRAKKPKACGLFPALYDDRMILWIGLNQIQYDSPSIKNGRTYPKVSLEKFQKWVAEDITDEIPKGEWAEFK